MKTTEDLKVFLCEKLPDTNIYLFGSRARGDAGAYSDIDIAIESHRSVKGILSQLRAEIEQSLLPYKVDLIDLSKAPYIHDIVRKEGVRWQ